MFVQKGQSGGFHANPGPVCAANGDANMPTTGISSLHCCAWWTAGAGIGFGQAIKSYAKQTFAAGAMFKALVLHAWALGGLPMPLLPWAPKTPNMNTDGRPSPSLYDSHFKVLQMLVPLPIV